MDQLATSGRVHDLKRFLNLFTHLTLSAGHLLSGKAITRVIRGHFLVDAAIYTTLLPEGFLVESSSVAESILQPEEISELRNLYTKLMNKEEVVADIERNPSQEEKWDSSIGRD